MKHHTYRLLLLAVFILPGLSAHAQIDTIRLNDKRLNLSALKMGERKYLLYMEYPGKKTSVDVFLIKMNLQPAAINGQKVIAIDEKWFSTDSAGYINYRSLNRASDFAPLYQYDFSENMVKAYTWADTKITTADTVAGNTLNGFTLNFKEAAFNGNQDLHVFEMLPLADGRQFAINFYVAGLKPPQFDVYKVSGSDAVITPAGPIDCWKLTTGGSYNNNKSHYSQCFWISKKTHELIKEENEFDGVKLHKIRVWD